MNKHLELQKRFQELSGQKTFINNIPDIETRKLRLKLALEELIELSEAFGLTNTFQNLLNQGRKHLFEKHSEIPIENLPEFIILKDTEEYNQLEVLDALIDIEVINNGSIITCGFQNIYDKNYEIVDTNNKTKFHNNYLEALKTEKYYSEKNIKTEIEEVKLENFNFYVIKNQHGKVLKPYNYEKVKLEIND